MTLFWRQPRDADIEFIVQYEVLYAPLLLDLGIAREAAARPVCGGRQDSGPTVDPPLVIEKRGRRFVQTMQLDSLVENYALLDSRWAADIKSEFDEYARACDSGGIDALLMAILFEVMPHFVRRSKGYRRRPVDKKEVFNLITAKLGTGGTRPGASRPKQGKKDLRQMLSRLEKQIAPIRSLTPGPVSGRALDDWLRHAARARHLDAQKRRLQKMLHTQAPSEKLPDSQADVLVRLARRGWLEIDGFGLYRVDGTGEYIIYKHTGPFALKDFYGRIYLFPDCRVALSTHGVLKPRVLEKYKHPFLYRHASGQEICMGDFTLPGKFTPPAAIAVLEAGLNALFYGYDRRRRNGYHPLDPAAEETAVHFEDLRIPSDHPDILSGQVEVKNDLI